MSSLLFANPPHLPTPIIFPQGSSSSYQFNSYTSFYLPHFTSFRSKFPYHPMTAIPSNAATILNVIATIPLAVNPSGNGAGGAFWPRRSRRSSYNERECQQHHKVKKRHLSSIIIHHHHHHQCTQKIYQTMRLEKKKCVVVKLRGKKGAARSLPGSRLRFPRWRCPVSCKPRCGRLGWRGRRSWGRRMGSRRARGCFGGRGAVRRWWR